MSEELIAEALHPYPDDLVVATKGGLVRPDARAVGSRRPAGARRGMRGEPAAAPVRPDPRVPVPSPRSGGAAGGIGALVALKEEGKIRHIGLSNVNEDQLRRAQALTPIVSIQNRYNPGDRSSEVLVDLCVKEHIAFLPWAPVQNLDRLPTLTRIGERYGATAHQVALAWLLARSETCCRSPAPGSVQHLEENVAAAGHHFGASGDCSP